MASYAAMSPSSSDLLGVLIIAMLDEQVLIDKSLLAELALVNLKMKKQKKIHLIV